MTTPMQLMQRPYGRLGALQIAVVLGGTLVQMLGEPVYMLVILVLAKTLMDAKLHTLERGKLGGSAAGAHARP